MNVPAAQVLSEEPLAEPAENDRAVDLVFTWVDADDAAWQRSKRAWMQRGGLEVPDADERCGDHTRYDNMREIVYAVSSARRFAPWLRTIYVVVADGQQVPPALANDVTVVHHSTIMPAEILPTFCSNSIEAFLHLIPGLSDVFLYANDDFLFWKPTPKEFFVDGDELRLRGRFLSRAMARIGNLWRGHMRIATRTASLLYATGLAAAYLPEHSIHVMRRSTCAHAWEVLGPQLAVAVSQRFRDENRSLFWQLLVYSLENVWHAPRRTLSLNRNVISFDAVERSLFARCVALVHLMLLARFPPHTACFNTIPRSWHDAMHRYFTSHLEPAPLELPDAAPRRSAR